AMADSAAVRPIIEAQAQALAEVLRPDLTRIDILNPTAQSFADFERMNNGVREIPNGGATGAIGATANQTLLEANTLSVRVTYCARLTMPLVDRFIPALLAPWTSDARVLACYAARRVPIVARAIVPMHSTPRRAAMQL
ncbi:MAG: hypothetical protein KDI32_12365, partial [Pseudomonadales bacterium]|nr:hypothetical protein [Pseudomonadales bacterium]